MPAHLAESPLTCVAVGSGRSLEEFEVIHRTNKNSRNRRRAPLLALRGRVTPSRLWRISPRVRQDGPPAAGSPRTARRQLPDPPHRLLRRVRRRRPALRAARRARRRLADPGGRQQGAQARARPLRLVRRHASTPRASSRTCARSATRCARRTSSCRPKLREQAPARRPDRAQQPARPGRQPPGVRARHRAGPQPVVHADHDRQGHSARRARQPARGQRRGARRARSRGRRPGRRSSR